MNVTVMPGAELFVKTTAPRSITDLKKAKHGSRRNILLPISDSWLSD